MKGDFKRKKSTFKRGQVPYNKGQPVDRCYTSMPERCSWKRCSRQEFDKLTTQTREGGYTLTDAEGNLGSTRLLRPLTSSKQEIDSYKIPDTDRPNMESYKILHPKTVEKLWNTSIKAHHSQNAACDGELLFDEQVERQIGLCWQESLKCTKCGFTSDLQKLYKETEHRIQAKRGPKTASPNVGLQAGLMTTGVGNTGIRNVLLHMNIAAPSMTSMQKLSNRVSAVTEKTNVDDMEKRRIYLRSINMAKGLDPDTGIAVESDCRYNNPLNSGAGRTPFQPATQCVYTVCENVSPQKEIIGLTIKNKLCKTAQILNSRGESVTCPNHSGHCTANISMDTSIGDEFSWCKDSFDAMSKDKNPLKIKYLTTDLDSRAGEALKKVSSQSGVDSVNLKCTRHLSQSQRRRVGNAVWSKNMFPTTAIDKKDTLKRRFSYNLSRRCTAEFKLCTAQHEGDIDKIKRKLSYVTDAIVECYKGNHSICKKHSYACTGRVKGKWVTAFLPKGNNLNITEQDEVTLRELISIRLGRKSIELTKLNTNTQKCESVNRAFSRTNPKNMTWSRNVNGRLHTAVHLLNFGFANSTVTRLKSLGAPLPSGTRVIQQLEKVQKQIDYHRNYKKTLKYKCSRAQSRIKLHHLHRKVQSLKTPRTYKRDCEMSKLHVASSDHRYAKRV